MSIDRSSGDRRAQPAHSQPSKTHLFDAVGSGVALSRHLSEYIQPADREDFTAPIDSLRHARLNGSACRLLALVDTLTNTLVQAANSPKAAPESVTVQTTRTKTLIDAVVTCLETARPEWIGPHDAELTHPTVPDGAAVKAISSDDLYLAMAVSLRHLPDEIVATAEKVKTIIAYGLQVLAEFVEKRRRAVA